jgi:hypothetical protein
VVRVAQFRFDKSWPFAVAPDDLWTAVNRTDDFRTWWSWLRDFDGAGVEPGATASCVIQAPLPYALRLRIVVERVEPASLVETHVHGDLEGPARLEIAPAPEGSRARLVWDLDVRDRMLRQVARVARPMMLWAHDRVVATGVEQFRRRALNGAPPRTEE